MRKKNIQRLEEFYKGHKIIVHRLGTGGAYTAFAMVLDEGRETPPFRGRIDMGEFRGPGARRRAYIKTKEEIDSRQTSV